MQLLLIFLSFVAVMQLIASFRLQSSRVISRTSAFPSSQLRMIQVGEVAPDFELKNSEGKSFKLSSFKGKKNVVVFFYPSDNTPGCTTEVKDNLLWITCI